MRVPYTTLALAAVLFTAACGSDSPDVLAPPVDNTLKSGGWIGSGNYIADDSIGSSTTTQNGGWIGSGNFAEPDTAS